MRTLLSINGRSMCIYVLRLSLNNRPRAFQKKIRHGKGRLCHDDEGRVGEEDDALNLGRSSEAAALAETGSGPFWRAIAKLGSAGDNEPSRGVLQCR